MIPEAALPDVAVRDGKVWLPRLLTELGLAASNGEARRLIEQGGVRLDDDGADGSGLEMEPAVASRAQFSRWASGSSCASSRPPGSAAATILSPTRRSGRRTYSLPRYNECRSEQGGWRMGAIRRGSSMAKAGGAIRAAWPGRQYLLSLVFATLGCGQEPAAPAGAVLTRAVATAIDMGHQYELKRFRAAQPRRPMCASKRDRRPRMLRTIGRRTVSRDGLRGLAIALAPLSRVLSDYASRGSQHWRRWWPVLQIGRSRPNTRAPEMPNPAYRQVDALSMSA